MIDTTFYVASSERWSGKRIRSCYGSEHVSENKSHARRGLPLRVFWVPGYLFSRSVHTGRLSRDMRHPKPLLCRLFRRTKPSHHSRRDSRQFKLLVCHQSIEWRATADAVAFACPSVTKRCASSPHQLYLTSASIASGRRCQRPL